MSTHDRGAFGQLLAEAKALGFPRLHWDADLDLPDDDECRWTAWEGAGVRSGQGRTGEEALRRLVEQLRVAPGESQG